LIEYWYIVESIDQVVYGVAFAIRALVAAFVRNRDG